MAQQGFLITREWLDTDQGVEFIYTLATDTGPTELRFVGQQAVFFIAHQDLERSLRLLTGLLSDHKLLELRRFDGEQAVACYFSSISAYQRGRRLLEAAAIDLQEADVRAVERFTMERFITGGFQFAGGIQGEQSNTYIDPKVAPSDYLPTLKWASVDIETDPKGRELFSIGVASEQDNKVWVVGGASEARSGYTLVGVADEKACLTAFFDWLECNDPDALLGWNVVGFDIYVLQQVCDRLSIECRLGRRSRKVSWREVSGRHYVLIPGRVCLDGIELLKLGGHQFTNFKLGTVGNELLGESKLLDGPQQILDRFYNNKPELADYNFQDCLLTWRIFEKTKLLDFAIERTQLTGLTLDKVGGSTAAFDYLYLPRLHRAGYVAPDFGQIITETVSPGGYVMASKPGLYKNVLVLDFKSLYPSIIRTFQIDPVANYEFNNSPTCDAIEGFDGAAFARDKAVLPKLIETLSEARERAKKHSNDAMSLAIKIIMNSFYGVLGSPGCRFFDPRLASSITRRGHQIIRTTSDWIEALGYDVIYGDTDSVFVYLGDHYSEEQSRTIGLELQAGLNDRWRSTIEEKYQLESFLEIEFETQFLKFLMPRIRGSDEGSKKRYAGLSTEHKLVVKGMESVRSDWSSLASDLQISLFDRLFNEQPIDDLMQVTIRGLYAGEYDDQLVYRVRLRRPVEAFVKSTPPHIKALRDAIASSPEFSIAIGDDIEYIMTKSGPQLTSHQLADIDYQHYVDKQLKPVAEPILDSLGVEFERYMPIQQQKLF